jgi:peptide/nickel transport system substrate-binding protein
VLRQIAVSCPPILIGLLMAAMALTAGARTRPHYGGVLRVEVEGDPWQRPGGIARSLVLDGLTAMTVDGRARPALALEWKVENDNHRWQFRLRTGVHFHDGTAMTAANVVASLNAICGAACPWTTVRAVGGSVIFLSDTALPDLPELLANDGYRIALMSDADAAPTAINGAGSNGTGPFQFATSSNGVLTLRANDNCWQGRPFLDAVEIRARRPVRDQWLDMTVGHADVVEIPAELLRQAHDQHLNVVVSGPVSLLALTAANNGPLASPNLRASIAMAVDRNALSNVIYQKQGEITASLLPADLTGYSFLFPADRDLNKAHELRGGAGQAALTLVAEGGATMQLAAQRIALNLRDAGFTVQVAQAGAPQHVDLTLRRVTLGASAPRAALASILRNAGIGVSIVADTPQALYKVERDTLDTHAIIPLLYLPDAYSVSGRVRDLRLSYNGTPLLAGASLEDAP